MGFWHTGYMEFHELDYDPLPEVEPRASYICPTCEAAFFSSRDLDVHQFSGHVHQRPTLILRGREVGRTRLYVTHETSDEDWVFRSANAVAINGATFSPGLAAVKLATKSSGYADVVATNGDVREEFQFEFALANADDLDGVDDALLHFIKGMVWGRDSIESFIMRGKQYSSAARYLNGIANYLYGVLAREEMSDVGEDSQKYEARYDTAVGILGEFDRLPAEAICGLVAFHYNHFDRAMAKTQSWRVSDVSKRFRFLLDGQDVSPANLTSAEHSSFDAALSDSTVDRVLQLSAIPLDGSAGATVFEAMSDIRSQRPYDQLKLWIVAAEHYLAAGIHSEARKCADELQHHPLAEKWYKLMAQRLGDTDD